MIRKLSTIILFVIVSMTWGTTFIAMKIAVDTIPPFFATGIRFLLTSPLLIGISYYTNTPLLFPFGTKKFQVFICIFYFSLPFSLMIYAGTHVRFIISSIIFASTPIILLILEMLFLKKKILVSQIFGIISSIFLLLIILYKEIKLGNIFTIKAIFALVFAMISHALIYFYSVTNYKNISVLTFNSLPSLFSGLFLLLISMFFEHPVFQNFSKISMLAIIHLSYFSGVFGILSYFYLQKRIKVSNASFVFFVFPFITLFLDNYIYNKHIIKYQELYLIFCFMISVFLTLFSIDYKKIIKCIKNIYIKFCNI